MRKLIGGALALCLIMGCTPKPEPPKAPLIASPNALFEDVAPKAGVRFTANTGVSGGRFYFIESTPSGGGFIDFDNDGNLDLFLVQPGGASSPDQLKGERPHCALFRNNGEGAFTEATAGSGFDKDLGYAHGIAVADYDNDGYDDIFVTSTPHNFLFRNEKGTGKFTDVTAKRGLDKTHSTGYATSAAFGDYDNDGKLDLYVCYYGPWSPATDKPCTNAQRQRDYCTPEIYESDVHQLFHNDGTRFTDVSERSGINKSKGRGLAVAFIDYDEDGKQDIFVANDLTPNMLWHNKGGGVFENVASEAGCAYAENGSLMAGMGIGIGDYNRTGHASLFVTSFAGMPNTLFKNQGDGLFENVADTSRVASAHMKYLSFGCEFIDYDADGWLDLMMSNGHVQLFVDPKLSVGLKQPKRLYRNQANGTFLPIEDATLLGDLNKPVISRGLAIGDFDNDGWLDALATNQNDPAQLFRNRGVGKNATIGFKLIGRKSNRNGCHAKIILTDSTGAVHTDWVRAGSSYLSASDRRVYFGLGSATKATNVEVHWPSGTVDKLADLSAGVLYTLTEGESVTQTTPFRAK